jgi:hypothetical protein
MAQLERAPCGLAHDGEGLLEQLLLACAACEPLAELGCLGRELLVVERLDRVLERVDALDALPVLVEEPLGVLLIELEALPVRVEESLPTGDTDDVFVAAVAFRVQLDAPPVEKVPRGQRVKLTLPHPAQ